MLENDPKSKESFESADDVEEYSDEETPEEEKKREEIKRK